MNINIADKWLREFLITKATNRDIAKFLTLCGPSVENIQKTKYGEMFSIEIISNRIDTASVYGIAREAAAILPRFGKKASLKKIASENLSFKNKVSYLKAEVDSRLCPRFSAVLIKNIKIAPSPVWMQDKLKSIGARSINNVVDISNFIMYELGQPVHTFDYDKIKGSQMTLREAKAGEKIVTLDKTERTLQGGDIVIEDGEKRLIDLCGIMGGQLSAVDDQTTNVLLFVQTYEPTRIRKTSMSLSHRTDAAVLFEKGLDPEQVCLAMGRAINLFKKICHADVAKTVLDIYPSVAKPVKIIVNKELIRSVLGIEIPNKDISKIAKSLKFQIKWLNPVSFEIIPPSFRMRDITIDQDVIEEIARLYGYHNIPSVLMEGKLPQAPAIPIFLLEKKIKQLLKGFGGNEVYTLSLVGKDETDTDALKLLNPLGKESEYLRTSLLPSLVLAVRVNSGIKEKYHLFEIANVYSPRKLNLPEEKLILAGIMANCDYRTGKGIVEALLEELHIDYSAEPQDLKSFIPSRCLVIKSGNLELGFLGLLEKDDSFYYEFSMEPLLKQAKAHGELKSIPPFPPQIEDITFTFPLRTKIGNVINILSKVSPQISKIILKDIYKDAYTFNVTYQHPTKTLTNEDVAKLREELTRVTKQKFSGVVK